MKRVPIYLAIIFSMSFNPSCSLQNKKTALISAKKILGNPDYLAMSYGGYRHKSRTEAPSVAQLKEDMKILAAMDIKLLRTYNTQQFSQASNLLEAIKELKSEDPKFEMYVMIGAWIECEGAWTSAPNHEAGNIVNNTAEIEAAVLMAKTYPDIVKIIAVGNESMVQWAASYYVKPKVVLNWVNYLQELKTRGELPKNLYITSSDNYESWGGGHTSYHTEDLTELIKAVDFVSLHTYPFHDSHYHPSFWIVPADEDQLSDLEKAERAMLRAKEYAISQYQGAADYITGLGIEKEIHIGETGWATIAESSYGLSGSKAADEYKSKLFYDHMRDWTNEAGMSCFYFEAFDEQWKDSENPDGSENHFGLITIDGKAKYALWDLVDEGIFNGFTRDGNKITKSYKGNIDSLLADILTPPSSIEAGIIDVKKTDRTRTTGEIVEEDNYIVLGNSLENSVLKSITYPSAKIKLNAWEGTCDFKLLDKNSIEVKTGTGDWWGCALEIQGGTGENLSMFTEGKLNFEIKGTTSSSFRIGFQTGLFADGTQTNNYISFGKNEEYKLSKEWKRYSIPITELNKGAQLKDVTALLFVSGVTDFDGEKIVLRNISYTKN
jgi:exo-beta-1,3-glucanase (GH17 family)